MPQRLLPALPALNSDASDVTLVAATDSFASRPCGEPVRISTQECYMYRAWLIADPERYQEYDLGPLKTGKEAEVSGRPHR